MASFKQYTASGGASEAFSIKTFSSDEIKVYVDNVLKSAGTHYNITSYTANGGTVTWTAGNAPSSGTVRIVRDTGVTTARATYAAGSSIKADDLNNNQTQALRSLEEQDDQLIQTYDIENSAITGDKIATNLDLVDNKKIRFGTGNDLEIFHDGSHSYIKDTKADGVLYIDGTGTAIRKADGSETCAGFTADGAVDLYHNGSKKFETTAAGATVTGTLTADLADNSIDSEHYVDGSIDTAHIAADAITAAKIADNAVTLAKLNSGALPTDITVASANLVDGTVATADIANDAITNAKIADNSIDSEHYVDGSVDTAHIADLNVTTAKIAADAITGAKIADDAIDSEHYVDGSIDTAHIGNSQVTTAKIADANVTTAKIADSNITTAKIAADAIDGTKIADNAIGAEHIAANAVTTSEIADAELTTLAGMQSGTASILAGGTALTATLAEINTVVDGKSVETTISDTDAAYPTS